MTDKKSTRTHELERRLEYAKRIREAFGYKGTADHEDVQSILRKYQEEIIKEATERIVEQLEGEKKSILGKYDHNTPVLDAAVCKVAFNNGIDTAIAIVKGVQNE